MDLQCNCAAMRSATRALTQAYDEVLRPSGLRTTQFSILARSAAVGPTPLSDLAEILAMDRTTLARNLQLLERDGLIAIVVGDDRRSRLVHVTSAGRKIVARAMPLWQSIQQRFEAKMGSSSAEALRDVMNLVVQLGRELSDENAATQAV
jgi:DNA-binding MarR family transcriptional regulator